MKSSIFIVLAFFLLSSVTFSEHPVGGWDGHIKHNGVVIDNDTIHVNYGEVVEIWANTYAIGGPQPSVAYFNWFLDDALVPLEKLGGGMFSGRYELNQPGKWVFRYMPGGNWSRNVVVVWDNEFVAEAFDPGQNFQLEEEEFHPESDIPPTTIEILPNPTRDRIKLVSNSKLVQLNILNQAGVIVHSSSPGTNEAVVHLNHIARGLYFAEVISEHGDRTIKRILVVD